MNTITCCKAKLTFGPPGERFQAAECSVCDHYFILYTKPDGYVEIKNVAPDPVVAMFKKPVGDPLYACARCGDSGVFSVDEGPWKRCDCEIGQGMG